MQTETLIVGAGLSGLSIATTLAAMGHPFLLVEARDRVGGRILTDGTDGGYFDLGPAWFWPGQPRIAALINRLGLRHFAQHTSGASRFEDEDGMVRHGLGYAAMQGSYRLEGGFAALTGALAAGLPQNTLHLQTRVATLTRSSQGILARMNNDLTVEARQVVLALPPRLGADIGFNPALDINAIAAMKAIPTWMAGQAKMVAVYERPFWRDAGLSGEAMSRRGPLVEIHDASTRTSDHHALFGFIGLPAAARLDETTLRDRIKAQLARIFGPEAATPSALLFKDWASDPLTATGMDMQPLHAHPRYGLPYALQDIWDGQIQLAGTEVAPQFGGYLEGALEAAEHALTKLTRVRV